MADDMDINCGDIMDGTASVEQKGEEIFRMIVEVASGGKSRAKRSVSATRNSCRG
jgi:altronate hydrolase